MTISTERLILYTADDGKMREMTENEKVPELRQAYTEMLDGCIKHPEERDFYAIWLMALKEDPDITVGDFCFKGIKSGTAEIGYGLYEGYCGKGYMTEAVKAASKWALSREGVTRVEAETENSNVASQKVLLRAGFIASGEIGEEGPRFVYVGEKE